MYFYFYVLNNIVYIICSVPNYNLVNNHCSAGRKRGYDQLQDNYESPKSFIIPAEF